MGRPSDIVENDFWAVHDLLMIGYNAYFMRRGTAGQAEVQKATAGLAQLLVAVHPVGLCRQMIASAIGGAGGDRATVVAAAEASWACLPAKFGPASFTAAFTEEALDDEDLAHRARDPKVLDPHSVLGACKDARCIIIMIIMIMYYVYYDYHEYYHDYWYC